MKYAVLTFAFLFLIPFAYSKDFHSRPVPPFQPRKERLMLIKTTTATKKLKLKSSI